MKNQFGHYRKTTLTGKRKSVHQLTARYPVQKNSDKFWQSQKFSKQA